MNTYQPKKFNKYDMVCSSTMMFGVILIPEIKVPFFEDGGASDLSMTPLDFSDPKEWDQTFDGCLLYDVLKQDYNVCNTQHLKKWEGEVTEGFIPFDHGTGRLREALGLIKLADKWYKNSKEESFLTKHLKNYK